MGCFLYNFRVCRFLGRQISCPPWRQAMNINQSVRLSVLAGAIALSVPLMASAQIKVGITVASTGPAASLGIHERNTVALLPTEVAGQKIEYIFLDDGTDTTFAVKNMRKLLNYNNVDRIHGTTVRPGSLELVEKK